MKIKVGEFLKTCNTNYWEGWLRTYSTEFFDKYFFSLSTYQDCIRFETKNLDDDTRNRKDKVYISIYFILYTNGNFEIKPNIGGRKHYTLEQSNKCLNLYNNWINNLYKDMYNMNLFYKED